MKWGKNFQLIFLMGLCFLPCVYAQQNRSEARDDVEDYDFSWLDPDKKVYVLQNRKYRKAFHPALYVSGALNLSNAFRSGYGGMGRGAMWFTEQFGIEGFGAFYGYGDTGTLTALKNSTSVLPYVREIKSYFGAVGAWAPFYGKFNFFNHILYYDWSLNLGAGIVNTANNRNRISGGPNNFVNESYGAIFFGTAQNFYVTRHFSVRLDLIGMNYAARGGDDNVRRVTNFDFAMGVGYIF